MVSTALTLEASYASLGAPLSTEQAPAPVRAPAFIRFNEALARKLQLDVEWLKSDEGLAMLSGNAWPEGLTPVATAYAGHQFGSFNPQLGDGRAVLLGEALDADGHRYDLQLKGSGRTPWSRGGDGRSPLGPMLREYLVSEAMHTLGVPTTRALAAVSTGEDVVRDRLEPGAILTRVASSHLRVGTLQYFAARDDRESLHKIVDHALARHYPERADADNPALALLEAVIEAQAELIARWQLLGFVHGVMNTDNMLLCGETVDYGPCAYMENFHPDTVFSSIDQNGRYAYSNQPGIAHWNLTRLAEALLALMDDDSDAAVELAKGALMRFPELFSAAHSRGLATKLGLTDLDDDDLALANDCFDALLADKADFTLAFRYLAETINPGAPGSGAAELFEPGVKLLEWVPRWMQRQAREETPVEERQQAMLRASPAFIARNHLVQKAISEGEEGRFDFFERLVERLADPFSYDAADRDLALPATPQERVFRTFCGT